MQGQSMLDLEKPGDATKIIATSKQLADFLRSRNPKVELYLIRDLVARRSDLSAERRLVRQTH